MANMIPTFPWLKKVPTRQTIRYRQIASLWAQYLGRTAASAILLIPNVATPFSLTENLKLVSEIGVSETYANIDDHSTSVIAQSGWITEVAPRLHAQASGTRVKGFFDIDLRSFIYAGQSDFNHTEKSLNSFATIEAVENWLFIDVHANKSQENRSIFDSSSTDRAVSNSSRTETTIYQVSPYIRGLISDIAAYQLRFNATDGSSSDGTLSDTKANEWVGRIKSASATSKLGWAVDGNALSIHNNAIGTKEDNRIYASLIYEVEPSLHISIRDGQETTNFAGPSNQSSSTPGFGLEWSPSARTQLAAVAEKRFFGNGHSLLVSNRTSLIAWQYKDNKDVTNALAISDQSSINKLMSDLLVLSIPDPVARQESVKSQLEATGNLSSAGAGNGVLTSRIFLDHNREASVALLGAINTVTLSLSQSDQTGIGPSLGPADRFSLSNDIRTRSVGLAWKHDLSALSSLTLLTSQFRNEGLSTQNLESQERSSSLFYSTLLGPRTTASAGYRRARFDSATTGGYLENAVVGSFVHRF